MTSEFDAAAAALASTNRSSITGDQLSVIRATLQRTLAARFPDLSREDYDDITSSTLTRFLSMDMGAVRQPGAMLIRIAGNLGTDIVRQRRPVSEPEVEQVGFDEIEAAVNLIVAREQLVDLMRLARKLGRDDLNQLLRVWLSLEWHGIPATSRAVADEMKISHTQVRRLFADLGVLLRRFS